ncbi:MAG: D-alanyl-D-alanine carboxypeptidase [Solirubrobacterales bacterium]|nr:D-alanyl-D-alanine carboxypeptidase [Solirubrobacterales bacterium]
MRTALLAIIGILVCAAWVAAGAFLLWPEDADEVDPGGAAAPQAAVGRLGAGTAPTVATPGGPPKAQAAPRSPTPTAEADEFAVLRTPARLPVRVVLRPPPAAGLMFNVDTGEVLWARRPAAELPIASLTKMMTALLIAARHSPDERVAISRKAPRVDGSKIGVLRTGTMVPLRGLFLGLLMASGNDAAVALAEHDAGSIGAFVKRMNFRAAQLGLDCTHYAGPAGLQDRHNHSCANDLAALARADLADPWIASVTSRRFTATPFPTRSGRLTLGNNHYFVQRGIAGVPEARVTGLKTGLTDGAGRCYVTTAELDGTHLGVVLLDSEDPFGQVPQLLRRGFHYEARH